MKNSKKLITFQIDFIDSKNEIIETIFKKYQDFNAACIFAQNQILNSNNKFIDFGIYDMYPRSLQK
jgi:hypothetical protein